VKALLEHGFSLGVDARNRNRATALHVAACQGHTKVVKLLLGHYAEVNVKDKKGRTALHMAEEKGHAEIAKLLKKGDATACVGRRERIR